MLGCALSQQFLIRQSKYIIFAAVSVIFVDALLDADDQLFTIQIKRRYKAALYSEATVLGSQLCLTKSCPLMWCCKNS